MTARQWTVWVEITRPDGTSERHAVGSIRRDTASLSLDGLGLQAAEAQALLQQVQQRLVQDGAAWQSGRRNASPVEQADGGSGSGDPCLAPPDGEESGKRRAVRQRGGKRRALSSTGRDGSGEAETGHRRVGPRRRGKG